MIQIRLHNVFVFNFSTKDFPRKAGETLAEKVRDNQPINEIYRCFFLSISKGCSKMYCSKF